jgi:hypothetical protein
MFAEKNPNIDSSTFVFHIYLEKITKSTYDEILSLAGKWMELENILSE